MHTQSFDDLVTRCLLDDGKCRLLYVFIRIAQMDDAMRRELAIAEEDAAVVQILFDAHQPVEPGLKFDQVRDVADQSSVAWTLCVADVATNADGSLPTEADAQARLAVMRDKVLAGDVDDYAVLNRDGAPALADPARLN